MPPKRKGCEEADNPETIEKIEVVLIKNEVTGRWVREDGTVGKKIKEK